MAHIKKSCVAFSDFLQQKLSDSQRNYFKQKYICLSSQSMGTNLQLASFKMLPIVRHVLKYFYKVLNPNVRHTFQIFYST